MGHFGWVEWSKASLQSAVQGQRPHLDRRGASGRAGGLSRGHALPALFGAQLGASAFGRVFWVVWAVGFGPRDAPLAAKGRLSC